MVGIITEIVATRLLPIDCLIAANCNTAARTNNSFSVLIPFVAARLGLIPPYGGTFHCSDPSLEFTSTGDTVSIRILVVLITVPVSLLVSYCKAQPNLDF